MNTKKNNHEVRIVLRDWSKARKANNVQSRSISYHTENRREKENKRNDYNYLNLTGDSAYYGRNNGSFFIMVNKDSFTLFH